jgi:dienelactone hydrolase
MRTLILILATLLLGVSAAQAKIVTRQVSYSDNGVTLKGYLAYDNRIKTRRPGVLVVHEWWGQNEYARKRARMLAGMGYTALAVDMYGDGKTASHPSDAGKFAAEVNKNMAMEKSRFEAAKTILESDKTVDQDRIAAIGYCFGGGVVLNMARMGEDLKAVASFHGALATDTPAKPGMVKAKVAVFTGTDDPMAPPKVVDAFETEMKSAGADYRLTRYAGAKHSFTNPDADKLGKEFKLPLAYNAAADQDSWKQLGEFLTAAFEPAR